MGILRILLVTLNTAIFGGLFIFSTRYRRLEPSPRVKRLWLVIGLISVAFLLGSIQRFLLQSTVIGWLSSDSSDTVLREWQLVQSLAVLFLAVMAFRSVKEIADSVASTEMIAGSLLDRVRAVDVDGLQLTKRETEILTMMATGLHTDSELTAALGISPHTVQSHIKNLLRKSGLSNRKDLVALAVVIRETNRS